MTTDKFVQELKQSLGDELKSVIAYGSSVRGDHAPGFSDVNLLMVTSDLGVSVLQKVFEPVRKWTAQKNPAPLFFTKQELQHSLDVFPIEFSEIIAHHEVLAGEDPFTGLSVDRTQLRWQLEYELRVKLLRLRWHFIESLKEPSALEPLMAKAVSSVTALMRAVLMVAGKVVPQQQQEVWRAVAAVTTIDQEALQKIFNLRTAKKNSLGTSDARDLFDRLLKVMEALIKFVDEGGK